MIILPYQLIVDMAGPEREAEAQWDGWIEWSSQPDVETSYATPASRHDISRWGLAAAP